MKAITYFSFPFKWFHFQNRSHGIRLENRRPPFANASILRLYTTGPVLGCTHTANAVGGIISMNIISINDHNHANDPACAASSGPNVLTINLGSM